MEAAAPHLIEPKPATLKKYGLALEAWRVVADAQGHCCAVCRQAPTRGRLCMDHEHVKGYKKMRPEEKVLYFRGLLCFRCNTTWVGRSITIERSQNVTAYLQAYEIRRPSRK